MNRTASARGRTRAPAWACAALILGGALQVAIWPIFTTVHGPTSFNRDREALGLDPDFWGSMMEGPSGLLFALGLVGSYPHLTGAGGRMARVGFVLTLIGIVVPSVADLVIGALVPPVLAPLVGIGLLLMAVANRGALSRLTLTMLATLGVLQLAVFAWALAVRPDMLDRIDGYRIQGVAANVLYGLAWIVLGASLLAERRATPQPSATPTPP